MKTIEKSSYASIAILWLCCCVLIHPRLSGQTTYEVTISNGNAVKIDVLVKTDLSEPYIWFFYGPDVSHLEKGWATFISDLRVHDHAGNRLKIVKNSSSSWEIMDFKEGSVSVHYTVDFSYHKASWPFGRDESPYVYKNMLYLVGRAILISHSSNDYARLHINVPQNWIISSSLTEEEGSTFVAFTAEELLGSIFVMGAKQKLNDSLEPDKSFHLVSNIAPKEHQEMVRLITLLLEKNIALLGPLQRSAAPYLIVVGNIPNSPHFNGAAYHNGFSMVSHKAFSKSNASQWLPEIAHELIHKWIGHSVKPLSYEEQQWFFEGFTEYVAMKSMLALNLLKSDHLKGSIKRGEKRFNKWRKKLSLKHAGAAKYKYKDYIYEGGLYIASEFEKLLKTNGSSLLKLVRRTVEEGKISNDRVFDLLKEECQCDTSHLKAQVLD